MNTKQSIYNILASAKKEPVKVELAAIDELNQAIKVGEQLVSQYKYEVQQGVDFVNVKRAISAYLISAESAADALFRKIQDLGSAELVMEKQASEIGVSASSIPQIEKAKKLRQEMKKEEDKLRLVIKELKK
jgi:hypothetical protein